MNVLSPHHDTLCDFFRHLCAEWQKHFYTRAGDSWGYTPLPLSPFGEAKQIVAWAAPEPLAFHADAFSLVWPEL